MMKVTYQRPPSTSFLSLTPGEGYINNQGQLVIKIESMREGQNSIVIRDGVPIVMQQDVAQLVTPVSIEVVVT